MRAGNHCAKASLAETSQIQNVPTTKSIQCCGLCIGSAPSGRQCDPVRLELSLLWCRRRSN